LFVDNIQQLLHSLLVGVKPRKTGSLNAVTNNVLQRKTPTTIYFVVSAQLTIDFSLIDSQSSIMKFCLKNCKLSTIPVCIKRCNFRDASLRSL